MRTRLFVYFAVVVFAFGLLMQLHAQSTSTAQIPRLIRFSGSLPVRNNVNTVGVTFALYKDEQGGAPLWMETQNVSPDAEGHYSVLLGANHVDGVLTDLFTTAEARWLGVQPEGEAEQRRVLLVSVPYAIKAGDAETLGGKPASAFLLAAAQGSAITGATTSSITPITVTGPGVQTNATAGTANYIAKFTDATSLGNSTIADVGGKIGIGTTAPDSILDIAANSSQTIRFGTTPWSLRIGSLQAGTQFIGIAVTKTGTNNNYIASSKNIATVAHTVMEFTYDGYFRVKQQAHQQDGAILNLVSALAITPTGNVGIGIEKPAQKMEVVGNVKVSGSGNGIIFPDGTVQTTAGAGGSTNAIAGVAAGAGLTGGGTSGTPVIALDTAFTDTRYSRLGATNAFAGDQSIRGALSVVGGVASGSHVVTGDVAASGTVSAATVQAHVTDAVAGSIGVSSTVDGTDATGVDVVSTATSGNTTGLHSTVNSPAGFAAIFDNIAQGSLILGRVKVGEYWVKRFRVDGNGRVYANNGYSTGGADFAESFAVAGEKSEYEPGDVLVIDRTARRRLTRGQQEYSTQVAGVYSTRPGVLASPYDMDNPNLDKEVPLAVIGVVPCKVTTANGPIQIGDLLVTSSLPGHAMKGTDRSRMLGAIVGKALQSLESGTGTIEILVTLQ